MDKIDRLLEYIHRTNPEMTRQKLIEKLGESDYSAKSIYFFGNSKFKFPKILGFEKYPPTFDFFDFKNPFAKFYKNLSRTCKELAPHFN